MRTMKYLLLAIALIISQCIYAADSVKIEKPKKVKTEKVEKSEKAVKADKTEKVDNADKVEKTDKAEKAGKAEKDKGAKSKDSVKVVTPPAPPAPLFTDIIPQPLSLVKGEGRFTINEQTALICDKGLEKIASYFTQYVHLTRTKGKKSNSIRLLLDENLGKEEYALTIDKKGVELRGGDYGGVFNGVQSLLQLLPHAVYTKSAQLPMDVSYIEVKDAPQYHYRGLLLDVARTFQPVHEVKRVIDHMAYVKLNKLHFHLVDNESWRVELKKYPNFAKEGGFRGGDAKLHPVHGRFNQKYGGYYTQDELRDIVAYAAQRNIEVIPEIDMPGHSKALGAIYPDILCNYTPDTSNTNGIDIRNAWCVAKESNYALIEDIVKELVEIFPSEYIHIGGDEVQFNCWEPCPDCQKLMKEKTLKDGHQLEQHFLNRVSDILSKYNRKSMVWDEAVEGDMLAKSTLVCGWRHKPQVKGWINSIKNGYQTIVMPSLMLYLDRRQEFHDRGFGTSSFVSLKTICDFSPESAGFSPEQTKCIAGIECAFWSEIYLMNINSSRHFSDYIEYMMFPRLFAVSEMAWSKQRRTFDDIYSVLKSNFYHKLRSMSATFRLESPTIKVEHGKIFASVEDGSKLYYTDIRTNKTQEYRVPLNANMAPFVTFQSRLMTGYSNNVGAPNFHTSRKERFTLTSSISFDEKYPASKCESYEPSWHHMSRTTRAAKKGDWILFRFKKPVKCSYLKVATGFPHLYRRLIYKGHLEVCYDGKNFVRAGNLSNGYYILRPKNKPIHALRIVADGISDAEDCVMIQSPVIK